MKREIYTAVFFVFVVLIMVSMTSAGFFDWVKGKITGEITSGTTSVNITVGVAPVVIFVSAISATDPTENGVKIIHFNFTVSDADGNGGINISSARVAFNRTGETTRTNSSCKLLNLSGTTFANFTCNIGMQYFDGSGAWQVNVTIKDNSSNVGTNITTTFTYNELTAMVMAPTALTWSSVAVTGTNIQSNNDPIRLNNTGNDNSTGTLVLVTAYDLWGETTTTQAIFAGNFTIDETDACDAGPAMQNATNVTITGALLPKGNHSLNNGTNGQEDIYFCLEALNPDLSSQSYSSAIGGAWIVSIAFAVFAIGSGITGARRNKKKIKEEKLVKTARINKNMVNMIFLMILIMIAGINFVSAFGISAPYWDSNPLKLPPGGSSDVGLTLQNMVGNEDMTLKAELRSGIEIATMTDESLEYFVPIGRDDIKVNLRIHIPEDAPNGKTYKVSVYFQEIASGTGSGMIQIAQGIEKSFNVIVESPVPEVLKAPAEGIAPQKLTLLIAIVLIIVIIAIIFYLLKKKKNSASTTS